MDFEEASEIVAQALMTDLWIALPFGEGDLPQGTKTSPSGTSMPAVASHLLWRVVLPRWAFRLPVWGLRRIGTAFEGAGVVLSHFPL
jgi:hypothetical protein